MLFLLVVGVPRRVRAGIYWFLKIRSEIDFDPRPIASNPLWAISFIPKGSRTFNSASIF
jgi:hypothetical protein